MKYFPLLNLMSDKVQTTATNSSTLFLVQSLFFTNHYLNVCCFVFKS